VCQDRVRTASGELPNVLQPVILSTADNATPLKVIDVDAGGRKESVDG